MEDHEPNSVAAVGGGEAPQQAHGPRTETTVRAPLDFDNLPLEWTPELLRGLPLTDRLRLKAEHATLMGGEQLVSYLAADEAARTTGASRVEFVGDTKALLLSDAFKSRTALGPQWAQLAERMAAPPEVSDTVERLQRIGKVNASPRWQKALADAMPKLNRERLVLEPQVARIPPDYHREGIEEAARELQQERESDRELMRVLMDSAVRSEEIQRGTADLMQTQHRDNDRIKALVLVVLFASLISGVADVWPRLHGFRLLAATASVVVAALAVHWLTRRGLSAIRRRRARRE